MLVFSEISVVSLHFNYNIMLNILQYIYWRLFFCFVFSFPINTTLYVWTCALLVHVSLCLVRVLNALTSSLTCCSFPFLLLWHVVPITGEYTHKHKEMDGEMESLLSDSIEQSESPFPGRTVKARTGEPVINLTCNFLPSSRWEPQCHCRGEQPAPGCSSVSLRRNRISVPDGTAPPCHQGRRPPAAHQLNENLW